MKEIKVPLDVARAVFDAAVHSNGFGSGYLEDSDVEALRSFAETLGLDPMEATPESFRARYPHKYQPHKFASWHDKATGQVYYLGSRADAELAKVTDPVEALRLINEGRRRVFSDALARIQAQREEDAQVNEVLAQEHHIEFPDGATAVFNSRDQQSERDREALARGPDQIVADLYKPCHWCRGKPEAPIHQEVKDG